MTIPKTITICGKPNRVLLDKKHSGGSFDENKAVICIGTASPADIPEILVHEIFEAVLCVRNMRYAIQRSEPENGDYRFVFNHDEFELACKDVAAALKGVHF